jgi:hypothetical protein
MVIKLVLFVYSLNSVFVFSTLMVIEACGLQDGNSPFIEELILNLIITLNNSTLWLCTNEMPTQCVGISLVYGSRMVDRI